MTACSEVGLIGLTGREAADRRSSSVTFASTGVSLLVRRGLWACWRKLDSRFKSCCGKVEVLSSCSGSESRCELLDVSTCGRVLVSILEGL